MVNNSLVAALGSVGAVDLNATTFTTPELLTSVAATGLFTLLILRHPRDPVGMLRCCGCGCLLAGWPG